MPNRLPPGSWSKMDLLLRADKTAVELKVTAAGRGAKKIKGELLVDINDYKGHPTVETLVTVMYDPRPDREPSGVRARPVWSTLKPRYQGAGRALGRPKEPPRRRSGNPGSC